jgi:hypothetical protein
MKDIPELSISCNKNITCTTILAVPGGPKWSKRAPGGTAPLKKNIYIIYNIPVNTMYFNN